jgi:Tfp pilus assembly protein PilX
VLEQKMSGNYYHSATAFQAAEFGLRVAEQWLIGQVDSETKVTNWFEKNTTINGLYTTQNGTSPNSVEVCSGNIHCRFDPRDESQWCTGGSGCVLPNGYATLGTNLEGVALDSIDLPVAKQPQFIIEHIGKISKDDIMIGTPRLASPQTGFRITVIGWGQEAVMRHVIQSHVILPL